MKNNIVDSMESAKKETTIFFGNGVNLLSKEGKSWDDILNQISYRKVLSSIPNTLKYESIVLPQKAYTDGYEGVEFKINGVPDIFLVDTELFIKEKLANKLTQSRASDFYKKLASIKADNYITTNYEQFIRENVALFLFVAQKLDLSPRPNYNYCKVVEVIGWNNGVS